MVSNFVEASFRSLPNTAAKGDANRWCPLGPKWFKVNSDSAASLNETWSATVGVVRDLRGH